MASIKIVQHSFDGDLVVGEYVTGTSRIVFSNGKEIRGTFGGVYQGAKLDTWGSGEMYHYLTDGHINGVKQGIFGHPVANHSA